MAREPSPSEDKTRRLRGLRRKLARRNRQPAVQKESPAEPAPVKRSERRESAEPAAILYRRDLPVVQPPRVPEGGGICIPLERCVAGAETACPQGEPFYLIDRTPDQWGEAALGLADKLQQALHRLPARDDQRDPPLAASAEELLFLDLETTGLGSSPVFLIGTLLWRDGELAAQQFLARTYAEEAGILRHFAAQAAQRPVAVSFNGKSFDVPYLRVRSLATGVQFHEPREHLDLLHHARRLYRQRLPDCKLQTLERYVCGRQRGHDIPSHDIPRAYHDFVRTGDAREMAQIIEHNLHDLVTMVHLLIRMAGESRPEA
jgi:uncharacterized protein YprB with RNaseH-like and TPR domain